MVPIPPIKGTRKQPLNGVEGQGELVQWCRFVSINADSNFPLDPQQPMEN